MWRGRDCSGMDTADPESPNPLTAGHGWAPQPGWKCSGKTVQERQNTLSKQVWSDHNPLFPHQTCIAQGQGTGTRDEKGVKLRWGMCGCVGVWVCVHVF